MVVACTTTGRCRNLAAVGPGSAVAAPAPGLSDSSCRQEEYYWRNPKAYPQHPPTLLVQPVTDCNADTDAARFYHEAMLRHGGNSAYGSRTRALCSAPEDGSAAAQVSESDPAPSACSDLDPLVPGWTVLYPAPMPEKTAVVSDLI